MGIEVIIHRVTCDEGGDGCPRYIPGDHETQGQTIKRLEDTGWKTEAVETNYGPPQLWMICPQCASESEDGDG